MTAAPRDQLMAAAEAIGKAAGYTNAGTIEFLVDAAGAFYFLEMNMRLQVEHPVTEAVTGIDFVQAQIRIAEGARLDDLNVRRPIANGHAIEVRVYAEDPTQGFFRRQAESRICARRQALVFATTAVSTKAGRPTAYIPWYRKSSPGARTRRSHCAHGSRIV